MSSNKREREKVSVNFDENDIRFARVAVRNEKERRDNELEVGGREGGDVEKKKNTRKYTCTSRGARPRRSPRKEAWCTPSSLLLL